MVLVLVFAVTLLFASLISALAHRSIVSTAVLFLLAGFVAGDGVAGAIALKADSPCARSIRSARSPSCLRPWWAWCSCYLVGDGEICPVRVLGYRPASFGSVDEIELFSRARGTPALAITGGVFFLAGLCRHSGPAGAGSRGHP